MEPPLFPAAAVGVVLERAKKGSAVFFQISNPLEPKGSKNVLPQTSAIQALVQQKQMAPAMKGCGCPTIVPKGNTGYNGALQLPFLDYFLFFVRFL